MPGDEKSLPTDFLGLSIEFDQLCSVIQLDTQHQSSYEQLYRNLGTGTLRIGGNTVDFSQWSSEGVASCAPDSPVITKGLVDKFFAFIKRIHWRVIWGLNLLTGDPSKEASEAAYVASIAGSNLTGFTIGNEPDAYVQHGYRPAGWDFADFYEEWSQIRDAVIALAPSAKVIGAETCCQTNQLQSFAQVEQSDPALVGLSQHFYISHTTAPTIPLLLDPSVIQQFVASAKQGMSLAEADKKPFLITESNSFSDGGVPGITNTLAAALWLSDYLLEGASLGVGQVDLHEAPTASYNAIDENGAPTPLYYALLLFHTMTNQAHLLPSSLFTQLNLTAYAAANASGGLGIVLINKEQSKNASVTINTRQTYNEATFFRLTGPDLSATSNITLGTKKVSAKGTWSPSQTPLTLHGATVTIAVPAGSAVYISLK